MTISRCLCRVLAIVHVVVVAWSAPAVAQDEAARPSLRERLKERRAARSEASKVEWSTRIDGPGDYRLRLEHDGLNRMYRVHVPKSYTSSKPMPMLMAFHGGGGNMDYQADDRYYGLISKSESAGFIVVFPNGYSRMDSGKLATWNAGNCCGKARDENVDDVGFVRKMLARLKSELNIDGARVFSTGMSNGAIFSYRLACELSDIVRGIAPVAGSDGMNSCDPSRPVSVLAIHAKDDEFVLFNGGAGRDSKVLANFVSQAETVKRWVQRNGCNPTPKRVLESAGAHCDVYSACRENTEVMQCVTESGGHSWPGGRKVRTGEPGSTAISANDVMWNFFMRH